MRNFGNKYKVKFDMITNQKVIALKKLGEFLARYDKSVVNQPVFPGQWAPFFEALDVLIERLQEKNPWFTPDNVRFSLQAWAKALQPDKIDEWVKKYDLSKDISPKRVGLIMAGNIPLVGFHDWLVTWFAGHRPVVKMSSSDNRLLPLLVKFIEFVEPAFKGLTEFRDGLMRDIDAVIATGSDNSARYFEYYFSRIPHIIRKNRNGVAVLTGDETADELKALASDMLLYFGLGCRNVTKIFIPEDFDLNRIFEATLDFAHYFGYVKYRNNYLYYRAIYSMSTNPVERESLLENGLIILKHDTAYVSPVSVVFYEKYKDLKDVIRILKHDRKKIQVVVSKAEIPGAVSPGKTQLPDLWDYADGVDTMEFLLDL